MLLLALGACHPLTPAEKTQALRGGLETGINSCRVYLVMATLPRDKKLDAYCPGIVMTKESP